MTKTKTVYEKELEKLSQGPLVRMCEGKRLDHVGDKGALIARLVAWEEEKPEPEPEVESPEPEPKPEVHELEE